MIIVDCVSREALRDKNVAQAARMFYYSPMWWDLYCRGCMPIERWPEYFNLRDAILGRKPWLSLAKRGSWRLRLAKWIAGF